jgi:hypothetical protein
LICLVFPLIFITPPFIRSKSTFLGLLLIVHGEKDNNIPRIVTLSLWSITAVLLLFAGKANDWPSDGSLFCIEWLSTLFFGWSNWRAAMVHTHQYFARSAFLPSPFAFYHSFSDKACEPINCRLWWPQG